MFTERAFQLLADLKADNTKAWFDAHRDAVKRELQLPFERVLEAVTDGLSGSDLPLRGGRQTLFRMNRDVRFSRDKSPYSTHLSGVLTPTGTKGEGGGLVYLQLDLDGGFLAAGAYKLDPKGLGPIRDAIVADPDRFRDLLAGLRAAGLALSEEMTLRSMPNGYKAHAEAWYAPQLKLQSFITRQALARSDWTSGAVIDRTIRFATACASLNRFVATA